MTILFRRIALAAALALPAGIALAAPQGGTPDSAPAVTQGGAPAADRIDTPARPGTTAMPNGYRERHELRERAERRREAIHGEAGRGETGRNEHRREFRHASRSGDGNAAMRAGDRIRHD